MNLDPISSKTDQVSDPQSSMVPVDIRLQRLRGVSTDFEAVLTQQMLEGMQKSLEGGGLVGGTGVSGSVYSGMLTEAIAKSMAQNQSFGLAEQLYKQVVQHEPELKNYVKTHPAEGDFHPKPMNQITEAKDAAHPVDIQDCMAASQNQGIPIPSKTIGIPLNSPIEITLKADTYSKGIAFSKELKNKQ